MIKHRTRKAREHAEPQHIAHNVVGVRKITDLTKFNFLVGRLAQKITGEHEPGANLLRLERANKLIACEGSVCAHSQRETKPAGVGSFGGDGEHQDILQRLKGLPQIAKIIAPRVNKVLQVVQLGQA